MFLAIIALLAGVSISAVAIYYSVLGLASIFSGTYIPIIVMGSILEVSKLVSAWWLKANWSRAPFLLKSYMFIAVIVLMLITSMGIFGFLSKAHSDQGVPLGNVVAQITNIDDRIKIQEDKIATAKQTLAQLDAQVNERIAKSTNGIGVDKSTQIRKQQGTERTQLQTEITNAQDEILKLKDQKAPLSSKLREVEAEVGPIKYIAKLIYGDNPDANLLEKAVVWVIITIVFVFDPLAVLLLLSSQLSFQWARDDQEKNKSVISTPVINTPPDVPLPEVVPEAVPISRPRLVTELPVDVPIVQEPIQEIIESTTPLPAIEPELENNQIDDITIAEENDKEIENEDSQAIKQAMAKWKAENPKNSLKHQRNLLNQGLISQLPWLEHLAEVDDAAIEAAKWAQEQIDKSQASKKKLKNG